MELLAEPVWRVRERAHAARVDAATAGRRTRRASGEPHPVEDFLFTYYSLSPSKLRRWHPGLGASLAGAATTERSGWRFYHADGDTVTLDVEAFLAARGRTVTFVRDLLAATLSRPAHLGCFGLHEWAMVHGSGRSDGEVPRHGSYPLRLGPAGTDDVVESHAVSCTHADAYRFFTASARPLNSLSPTRDSQVALEQPGCLHAGMDCYKWAYQLAPASSSALVADCFDLARDIRVLDMRAAPYDLTALGLQPVCVETRAGKAEYLAAQRAFVPRANALRRRILEVCDALLAHAEGRHVELEHGQLPTGDDAAGHRTDPTRAVGEVERLGVGVGFDPQSSPAS